MNITWKRVMGIVGSTGTIVSGIKAVQEVGSPVWRSLNPWAFSFCLFAALLIALGVLQFLENLEKRFKVTDDLAKSRFDATDSLIKTLNDVIQEKENEVAALRSEVAQAVKRIAPLEKKQSEFIHPDRA